MKMSDSPKLERTGMADLIFCCVCHQDVSHDGAYVLAEGEPHHRSCFVDWFGDAAQDMGFVEVAARFVAGPNFSPDSRDPEETGK